MDVQEMALDDAIEREYYRDRATRDPKNKFWTDSASQIARFDALINSVDFKDKSILDVGCGTADLLAYLLEKDIVPSRYFGVDIVPEFIEEAKQLLPQGEYLTLDVSAEGLPEETFDFVVASGLFTLFPPEKDWWDRLKIICRKMWARAGTAFALNVITIHSSARSEGVFYAPPAELLSWLQAEFSPYVRVDHSYRSNDCLFILFRNPNCLYPGFPERS